MKRLTLLATILASLPVISACGSDTTTTVAVAGRSVNVVGDGLTVSLDGKASLSIPAGSSMFVFPDAAAQGSSHTVSITAMPAGQACTVVNGSVLVSNAPATLVIDCEDRQSCKQLHADMPTISTGAYRIDVDGLGGFAPFPATCDMDFDKGGWTLVLATSGGHGPDSAAAGPPVAENTSTYLPLVMMQVLAKDASQVTIRTPGHADTESVTSKPDNEIIANIRLGHATNVGLESLTAADQAGRWTGPFADVTHLSFGCVAVDVAWPSVLWACGNPLGTHLVGPHSTWSWANSGAPKLNTPLAVYLR